MSIQGIKQVFECPISAEVLDNPMTTPCGHTFDAFFLLQHLKKQPNCPIDRKHLLPESLTPNHLAKEISEYLNNTVSIFLSAHQKAPQFIEVEPPRDPPCHEELKGWTLFAMASKLIGMCFNTSRAQDNIEIELAPPEVEPNPNADKTEHVKKINQHLKKQITKFGLDNRDYLRTKLRDPLSKQPLTDPFIAQCGHTFDKTSFRFNAKCPFDQQRLQSVVKNYLIREALDDINAFLDPNLSGLEEDEKITGVWVHLPKDSTMRQVEELAKGFGFFANTAPENAPLFKTSNDEHVFFDDILENYEEILEDNPVIKR
ncbi:MAG: hypothetical protein S4CHLAM123_14420 [Chlamydiales bacterium]|nr:hypothetical protein [Chlamydiales bacterium]